MRRVLLALLLLAAPGCSGDAGPPAARTPGPAVTTSAPATPSATVAPLRGAATVTYGGRTARWPERGCETTRGFDGRVVGWLATFQDAAEQARGYRPGGAEPRGYVQLALTGYTGAGTYTAVSARIAGRTGVPVVTGPATRGQSLVLRAGGRSGTYRHGATVVELTCDPGDDTSTRQGAAVPRDAVAGTAYVERPGGAVFAFRAIECAHEGDEDVVTAGAYPRLLRVSAARSSDAARVLFAVHGVVLRFETATTAAVALESGTFRSGIDGTRGAWTCDH